MKKSYFKPIALAALLIGLFGGCEKELPKAIEGQSYCIKAEFIAEDIHPSSKYLFDIKESNIELGKKFTENIFDNFSNVEKIKSLNRAIIVPKTSKDYNFSFEKGKTYFLEVTMLPFQEYTFSIKKMPPNNGTMPMMYFLESDFVQINNVSLKSCHN